MIRAAAGVILALLAVTLGYSFVVAAGLAEQAQILLQGQPETIQASDDTGRVRALTKVSPLNAKAYLAEAHRRDARGDPDRALALAEHAARLNPRLAEARMWLGIRYLRDGRIQEGVRELTSLHPLRSRMAPQINAILGEASRDRSARLIIASRLANSPHILDVLRRAANLDLTVPELSELLRGTDVDSLPNGRVSVQQTLTARRMRERDYEGAYAVWRSLLPPGEAPGFIFDSNFEGKPASPPFAWTIRERADLGVRRMSGGAPQSAPAAEFSVFGSLPVTIAEQTLVLRPQRYRLRALTLADGAQSSFSGFSWVVTCLGGAPISELLLNGTGRAWREQSWTVTVPVNCPSQVIQLHSDPAISGGVRSLQLSGVRLEQLPGN
jgi:hypothetical protein